MDFSLILKGFMSIAGDFFPFLNRTSAAAAFHFVLCLFLSMCWVDCYNALIESC